jgi:hypothetical protein
VNRIYIKAFEEHVALIMCYSMKIERAEESWKIAKART